MIEETPTAIPETTPLIKTTTETLTTMEATSANASTRVSHYCKEHPNQEKIFVLLNDKPPMNKTRAAKECEKHSCRLPTITSQGDIDDINSIMKALESKQLL